MSRYYKKRRYRKQNDELGGLLGLLTLGVFAYAYTHANDFNEKYPYVLLLIGVVAAILISVVVAVLIHRAICRKHVYDAITVAAVDSMDGLEFERYLADLLRKRGYTNIQLTEKFDFGVDIIAKKDGITWGIQAKRYTNPVKAEAVRQAYTALNRYKCDRAMVITNSTYSNPARILAKDNQIPLVDRETLSEWIYEASRTNRGAIL
jgi:restriction system protein